QWGPPLTPAATNDGFPASPALTAAFSFTRTGDAASRGSVTSAALASQETLMEIIKMFVAQSQSPVASSAAVRVPSARRGDLNFRNIQVRAFNSKTDNVDVLLRQVRNRVAADEDLQGIQWPQRARFAHLSSILEGQAAEWFANVSDGIADSDMMFDYMAARLRQEFGSTLWVDEKVRRIMTRVKTPIETYSQYASELRKLGISPSIPESTYVMAFVEGVDAATGTHLTQLGHYASKCPTRDKERKRPRQYSRNGGAQDVKAEATAIVHGNNIKDTRMARVMTNETDELPTAAVVIRGRGFGLKLDTCAACSIASSDMRKWGVKLDVRPTVDKVHGLGDAAFNVEGHEFFMGKDFFEQKRASISFATQEITFKENGEEVTVPFVSHPEMSTTSSIRVREQRVGVLMPTTLATAKDGNIVVCVVNMSENEDGVVTPDLSVVETELVLRLLQNFLQVVRKHEGCPPPNFPVPKDAKEIKRFVHLASYYRREQRDAFEDLKGALAEKLVLMYPRFDLPFVLSTDVSIVGCDAPANASAGSDDESRTPAQQRVSARERWRQLRSRTQQLTRGLPAPPVARDNALLQHAEPGASMLHKDFWLEALDAQHRYGFHLRAFHRAWKDAVAPADRRNASFFFWLDRGAGRALELPECSRHALQSRRVEYCDAAARRAYEVQLVPASERDSESGDDNAAPVRAVFAATQRPVHTDALSKWIFVVALDGRLYVGRKRKGAFHHSSFVAGAPILAAGKLMVQHGQLVAIEPHSGHYKPTSRNLAALCGVLRAQGVALAHVAFIRPKKWASTWPFPDVLPAHLAGCELEDLASDTDYCSYKSDSDEP
ncbi:hypothetical protein PybrP1_000683, partial [[Pythium] brassicae (nom. inval.)]